MAKEEMTISGKDVANVASVTGKEIDHPLDRMLKFHSYMLDRARQETTTKDLADQISASKADAIFAAETEDDIWNAGSGGTVQGRDAVGLEVEVNSFRSVLSTRQDIENGNGYYISADATCLGGPEELLTKLGLRIGQEFALQTGADDIVFRLRAFEVRELLPIKGKIDGVKTQSGQTVLLFKRLPRRAVPATTA
jgi:hypothetical protein